MRIARLVLKNFRVYETLDLEIPAGVVGIYGPNGSGKSTLLDAVLWSLFGISRTAKGGLRSDGITDECSCELTFEHEGHLYEIHRALKGINDTVTAEAICDGLQVAGGARDVGRYVTQVLGMNDDAFRSSVFCEQKQLDAFSREHKPAERRRLVLSLLGIEPLDRACDTARKQARTSLGLLGAAQQVLADPAALEADIVNAQADVTALAGVAAQRASELSAASQALAEAQEAARAHAERKEERDRLLNAYEDARRRSEEAAARVAERSVEFAAAQQAASALPEAERRAGDIEGTRSRIAALEALCVASAELEQARTAQADRDRAQRDYDAAQKELGRAGNLDPSAPCPLCGQELGENFGEVRDHRERAALEAQDALKLATQTADLAQVAAGRVKADAEEQIVPLRLSLKSLELARDELVRLRERAANSESLAELVAREKGLHAATMAEADENLKAGKALGFDPEAYAAALSARDAAQVVADECRSAEQVVRLDERGAIERLAERQRRRDEEAIRAAQLGDLETTARHQSRLAELLASFRNTLVGEVGPALSRHTSALFCELTDQRFDRLEVNPETFELGISRAGQLHPVTRHSGSEVDLANLALRVAISEQVTLLSGGQVGLLVLDEVLGALDTEHRDRTLGALTRLGARFRQVLVVTHATEVKEQLPYAIEVVPLGNGRSIARLA